MIRSEVRLKRFTPAFDPIIVDATDNDAVPVIAEFVEFSVVARCITGPPTFTLCRLITFSLEPSPGPCIRQPRGKVGSADRVSPGHRRGSPRVPRDLLSCLMRQTLKVVSDRSSVVVGGPVTPEYSRKNSAQTGRVSCG